MKTNGILSRALAGIALGVLTLPAAARPLPNVDALSQVAPSQQVQAVARDARVSRAHIDSRLGRPTFVWLRSGVPLLSASAAAQSSDSAARETLNALASYYGMTTDDVASAVTHSTERLAQGANLVRFKNRHEGIDVFREFPAVILDARNQPVAVGGAIGPTKHAKIASTSATPFRLTAPEAIARALADYSFDSSVVASLGASPVNESNSDSIAAGYQHYEMAASRKSSDGAVMGQPARAKRVWFRMPEGLVPAWYVEISMVETFLETGPDNHSYVIAADDGRLLFRNNLTADAAFTYRVYGETSGEFLPYPGPQGRAFTPHPTGNNDGSAPALLPSANLLTLQSGPISTNDAWLPFGATKTSGNNVEAFSNRFSQVGTNDFTLDVDPLECDTTVPSTADFRACTTAADTFDYSYNYSLDVLANKTQMMAGVTNVFYMVNWLHDWYYDSGFREIDGNAQASNYGRGGTGGDRINAQTQDLGGTDNANMTTFSDGGSPRMRMYRFTGPGSQTVTLAPGGTLGFSNTAQFGAQTFNITAQVVLAIDGTNPPNDACSTITNAAAIAGKIALVDRGICGFAIKAANVQAAGAIGMIVANNVPANPGGMAGVDPSVTLAAVIITQADGVTLKNNLGLGMVNATLLRTKAPDYDGAFDNSVVAHEWGHYLSNRLIADANGLGTNQAGGLGEGWGDFVSLLMQLKSGDNINATYALGGYDGGTSTPVPNSGWYAGFRRYPYSRDFTKNPLTFKHMADSNPLPASPLPTFTGANSEVHNTGEVWATMLWQCYTSLVGDSGRLTFVQAQSRMKAYLVAGLKLTPANPTLLEARDGVLAAMAASDPADLALCGAAFAQRGAGALAVAADRFSGNNNGVVESFSTGGELKIESVTFDARSALYCDADAALDNGETGYVTVTVRNIGTQPVSGAMLSLSSSNINLSFPDGGVAVPTLAPLAAGITVRARVGLSGAAAPGTATVTATVSHSSLPSVSSDVGFLTQLDRAPASSAIDDVESESTLWTTSVNAGASTLLNWKRAGDPVTGRYWNGPTGDSPGVGWLTSPPLTVAVPGTVTLTITHRHDFESGGGAFFDGGVIEASFDNGATWTDIQVLGATTGYNGVITPGSDNPLSGRNAFVDMSAGYPAFNTVAFNIPATAGTMRVRFGAASDLNTFFEGWDIDSIGFTGIANTPFESTVPNAGTCTALSAFAGTPQVASVNTPFGTQLTARLLGLASAPVQGASVTFTAPSSGASGTFAGGGTTATVATGADGKAIAPVFTANATGGNYAVSASAGASPAVTFSLTNVTLVQLSVTRAGSGSGTVVSMSPAGTIACGSDCSESYVGGTAVTLAAAATVGSTFSGWSGDCTGTGDCVVTMNGARNVTATFSLTYTVTPSAGSNGTITPSTVQTVSQGATTTFTVTPSAGYTAVVGGSCGGNLAGTTYTTSAIVANCTVSATFTQITYTVTPSAGANGSIAPSTPQTIGHGGTTSFTVTPNGGYGIDTVSGCGGSLAGSTFTTAAITANCTVTATFKVTDPPRLGNISTRMQVLTGGDVMIGGFVIGGSTNKKLAIVVAGPSLSQFGITNPLANPTLSVVRSSDQAVMATSDDWQTAPNSAQLTASGFAPTNTLEAGVLVDLAPGAYTVIVQGAGGGTGVAVLGIYEVDHPETPLSNISTRGRVLTGNDVMIGGFVVTGSGPQTVAIVATGPSLAAFGITSPLANPTISLVRSSDQSVIATNDNWQTDANASLLQGAGFAPTDPNESGLYVTLQPGAYTVVVQGVSGGTGVAVIGVYKVN